MDPKRLTPRHIIIKMTRLKDTEKILKAAIENQVVTSKGAPIRLGLSFKIEGEIRSFPDKKKLKEFINTKPVLQQMIKGLFKMKKKKREKEKEGNSLTIKWH